MSSANTASSGPSSGKRKERKGPFARISLFVRESIAELRKVLWPTRKELVNYTGIVIVFVLIMAGIVALLDFVFTRGVLVIFGGA